MHQHKKLAYSLFVEFMATRTIEKGGKRSLEQIGVPSMNKKELQYKYWITLWLTVQSTRLVLIYNTIRNKSVPFFKREVLQSSLRRLSRKCLNGWVHKYWPSICHFRDSVSAILLQPRQSLGCSTKPRNCTLFSGQNFRSSSYRTGCLWYVLS